MYRDCIFSSSYNIYVYLTVFMRQYVTCIGKMFEHLMVSHAFPVRRLQVTAVLKFIVMCIIYYICFL
jgi:hypothetical protein